MLYLFLHIFVLMNDLNKSTQRAQTSLAEAAHYPHIVWIPSSPNIHSHHFTSTQRVQLPQGLIVIQIAAKI